MMKKLHLYLLSLVHIFALSASSSAADRSLTLDLWPGVAPGDESLQLEPEHDRFKEGDKLIAGRRIIKLANVSKPQITVYRPAPEKDTGAAVIVAPGGGYHILAYDLEGTEVAEWLNGIGVTGIVLKYRVPARNQEQRHKAAVQDAQRAISIVRSRAKKWQIDPRRIGILGFSAGGHTAGMTSLLHKERTYQPVDATDRVSCRPDFAALIYPGGFVERGEHELRDDVSIPENVPPFFFAHAFDDRVSVQSSLLLASELKKAGASATLHVYPSGGHGYGLRRTHEAVTTWPDRCEEWMRSLDLLETGRLVQHFTTAWQQGQPLPALSSLDHDASLDLAYRIQRRWIGATLSDIGGVKGAAVTPGGQKLLKLKEPLGAILRGNGRFEAKDKPVVKLKDWPGLKIETEIGFIIGKPIDREPRSLADFKKRVRAVIPMVELPAGRWTPNGGVNAVDLAAVNVTSAAYIVGEPIDPKKADPRNAEISLTKNGQVLHTASGEDCWQGPWETAFWLSKFARRQGITLKPGQIIICGALGKIHPGSSGQYRANYGDLGTIEFTLQ